MATATATVLDAQREYRRGQIYVALAALAWSTAGVLQRGLQVDTATQVALRAAFACVTIFAYVAVTERGRVVAACRSVGVAGIGFAVAVACASGSFIVALNHTTVAHVLFIQAMAPVLAALLAWLLLGEPIARRTAVAMGVALVGVGVMIGGPGGGSVVGDALSLLMAFSFAVAIVISRHRRDVSMAPATCLSQVVVFVLAAPFAGYGAIGAKDTGLLVLLGVTQIGLGLIFLSIGGRLLPAAEVGLITLLEIVLGPLWVWVFLSERPSTATLIGGVIVLAAVLVQSVGEASEDDAEQRVPERRLPEGALRPE